MMSVSFNWLELGGAYNVLVSFHPVEADFPIGMRKYVVTVDSYCAHQVGKAVRKIKSA
jgi:hypothetical protein